MTENEKSSETKRKITFDEAMQYFLFLKNLQVENTTNNPLEVELSEMDRRFLNQSLMESESEALGHERVRQTLYVVDSNNNPHPVDVRRLTRNIYPPEYLHPGMDFPPDEPGWSETIQDALARENLTAAQYVVLHRRGVSGGWSNEIKPFNNLTIVSVKSELLRNNSNTGSV